MLARFPSCKYGHCEQVRENAARIPRHRAHAMCFVSHWRPLGFCLDADWSRFEVQGSYQLKRDHSSRPEKRKEASVSQAYCAFSKKRLIGRMSTVQPCFSSHRSRSGWQSQLAN